MRRLFDADPVTKTKRYFREDSEGFGVESVTDVTDVVEDAKANFNLYDERTGWKGDIHHVARIPSSVWFSLPKEMRDDPAALKRWLNDPDQRAFRTRPGRV